MPQPPGSTSPPASLGTARWRYHLNDRPAILRVAWFPYAHIAPSTWPGLAQEAQALGVHSVALPISWVHHAPHPDTLDLDGSTDPTRDLMAMLSTVANLGLGLIPVLGPANLSSAAADLPAWLGDATDQAPSPWDARYRRERDGWDEAVAQTVAALTPDYVPLWGIAEPPGPSRADSAAILAYHAWLRQRYDDPAHLSQEWQRPITAIEHVEAPAPAAVPAEQRDWRLFDASVRGEVIARRAQSVRDLFPDAPVAVLAPARRRTLARVAHVGEAADLLVFVTEDAPAVPAQLTTLALDESRPSTVWGLTPRPIPHIAEKARPFGMAGSEVRRAGPPNSTWRATIAALARGAESVSWPLPDQAAPTLDHEQRPALSWLRQVIDRWEHDLANSWPVYDPLALLWHGESELVAGGNEPLSASTHGWLIRLLNAAGWSPECLDLAAVDDEALGEFLGAIVIGRGWLDLESYGKLLVYAVGGGHLLTVGAPIRTDDSARPINTHLLYPRPILRPPVLPGQNDGGWRTRWRRLWPSRQPKLGTQTVQVAATDPPPVLFGPGPGTELWWHRQGRQRGPVAAYRTDTRSGSSTVIGSAGLPARAADQAALQQLLAGVLDPLVPRRLIPDPRLTLDLALRRLGSGGVFLFASNAGPAQQGVVQLRALADLGVEQPPRVEVVATARHSTARLDPDGQALWLAVDAGDAMIVRLR